MKCGKCGAQISDGSLVCAGCNTPVAELEMNNLLIKENVEGVVAAPEAPVVEVAPVVSSEPPVIETPEPVVVEPVSVIPPVENIADDVVSVEPTSVVEVVPEETVSAPVEPVTPATPVVEAMPEVLPNDVPVVEDTVVTVTPESVPVVEPSPADSVSVEPVVTATQSEGANTSSVLDELSSDSHNTLVTNPTNEAAPEIPSEPAAPVQETPVSPVEENTIINSVVSDVAPTVKAPAQSTPEAGTTPEATEKPKKGGKIGLIIGGVLVVLLIAVVCWYFLVYTKPVNMFKSTLGVFKSQLNKTLETETEPTRASMTFKTKLSSSDPALQETYDKLNNLYLEVDLYTDMKSQIMQMGLLVEYKDKTLLDLDALVEKAMAYFKFEGAYDKYISMELEENLFEDDGSNDAAIVVDGFLTALDESLKSEYFTKVNKTITLNNEQVEVKANTLVINSSNIGTLVKDIVEKLQTNAEFVSAFSRIEGQEDEDTIAQLNDFITATSDTSSWSEEQKASMSFQVTLYTTGLINTPVGMGFSADGQEFNMYFNESSIVVYLTEDGKESKVLDVTVSGTNYIVNAFVGEDVYTFEIGFKVDEKPTFTKPDVTNSVKYTELTEEDAGTLMIGIMTSEGFTTFSEDFADLFALVGGLLGGGTTEPDYDYEDDMYYDEDFDYEYDDTYGDIVFE